MYYKKSFFTVGYVLLEDISNMRTSFTGWHILHYGMHYRRTCVRGGYTHYFFGSAFVVNIAAAFPFSKCSLCDSLVDISCKCGWCPPLSHYGASVIVWQSYHVDVCGVPLLSYSGASVFV